LRRQPIAVARPTGRRSVFAGRHLGRNSAFVQEDQFFRRDRGQADEKFFAPLVVRCAAAFGGVRRSDLQFDAGPLLFI